MTERPSPLANPAQIIALFHCDDFFTISLRPHIVHKRRMVSLALTALLLLPTTASPVAADWDEDNWLWNIIGPERLEMGDEFGCHGYEGVDVNEEPWVIEACRDYLMEYTQASRWGEAPVSFGLPPGAVASNTTSSLAAAGFNILGDMLEVDVEGFEIVQRSTSLEKGQANLDLLRNAQQDSLLSLYWIARWHDVKIREDKNAIDLLESQDVWFTTWGEWHEHRHSSENFDPIFIANPNVQSWRIHDWESTDWSVPGTALFEWNETPIDVQFDGVSALLIDSGDRHLATGIRPIDGGAYITAAPGVMVDLIFENSDVEVNLTPQLTFNGLHHAVAIVGHHTTDLHQWSSDFHESPLRFTWLIERPATVEMDWKLPVLAVIVLIATPVSIKLLVARDQNSQQTGIEGE